MQRTSRASRSTKKARTSSTRSTSSTASRAGRSSSLASMSVASASTSSRSLSRSSTAVSRSVSSSSSKTRAAASVVSRKVFSTSASDDEQDVSVQTRENSRRAPAPTADKRTVTRPKFFKAEHADNFAVNSVPKFGRAQLSQPFPPLRQKIVNPDLTFGDFTHHDISKGWHVIVSYPKDFTFVCPSELNELADRINEFKAVNTKVWGLSCDSENVHHAWMTTPRKQGGIEGLTFPLIADVNRVVTASIGALLPENFGTRATMIYGNGKLRHASFNEPPVGRSVDEILRLVSAFQYFDENGEVCPAKWKKPGDATMVPTKEGSRSYFEQEQ